MTPLIPALPARQPSSNSQHNLNENDSPHASTLCLSACSSPCRKRLTSCQLMGLQLEVGIPVYQQVSCIGRSIGCLQWRVSCHAIGMHVMTLPMVISIDPNQACVLCAGYSLQAVFARNEVRRAERRHEQGAAAEYNEKISAGRVQSAHC